MALAGLVLPLAANAQVMFDTTRVTCADYLAMSSTDAPLFSAFISARARKTRRPSAVITTAVLVLHEPHAFRC